MDNGVTRLVSLKLHLFEIWQVLFWLERKDDLKAFSEVPHLRTYIIAVGRTKIRKSWCISYLPDVALD